MAIKRKPFMAEIVRVLQSAGFSIDDNDMIYSIKIEGSITEVSLDHNGMHTKYRCYMP